MKKSFKEILKSGVTKVAGLALVIGMSVSIMTACGQKNTGDAGKKDPTKTPITVEDPEKEDPTPGQENPGQEDPTPGQEDPGKEDPTPGQEDPGKEDPTPGQENPGQEDPTPGQEEPGQEDPTPGQDEPTPEEPQPGEEKLDFSALETKLEEIGNNVKTGYTMNELVSYSVDDGDIYIVVDASYRKINRVAVYRAEGNFSFETQEAIDNVVSSLSASDFSEITAIQKASSDITVDGETYSKDGIVGDNIFAEQCGVENALMTYVGGVGGGQNFDSRFDTGYSKPVEILALYNDANNNLVAKKASFAVESFSGYTSDQIYINLVTEGKNILRIEEEFNLGENLKASPEVEAMNAAWFNEGEDYVQDGLNYIYDHIEDFIYKNYVKE